jgi:hypothetical protein
MRSLSIFGKFCLIVFCFCVSSLVADLAGIKIAKADPSRPTGINYGASTQSIGYVADWLKEIRNEMKEQTKQQKRIADALEKKCN